MKTIFAIFGTRPEAIKISPVIQELNKIDKNVRTVICVTAQHREMLDQILNVFKIIPDIDFNLMRENQTLAEITYSAMVELTKAYRKYKPDIILIQGDTTSAMVAALTAFYEKIPIGHIEAGLRTYNRYFPFPEEINRRIISVLSNYHFAPTKEAANALLLENIPNQDIFVTGNPVVDALNKIMSENQTMKKQSHFGKKRILLVTIHRRENIGRGITDICNAIIEIIQRNNDIYVVFPVHLNPNVRKIVYRILKGYDRILLLEPLDYSKFIKWMKQAYLILSDSGGIQEEAAVLGIPVLILRNETERMEGIYEGISRIVGTNKEQIVKYTEQLIFDKDQYNKMAKRSYIYGDGKAAERIAKYVLKVLDEDN